MTTCPHCQRSFEPPVGAKPPWCPRCGADLNRPPRPAAPPAVPVVQPVAEPVLLTPVPAAEPPPADGRWSRQPHRPPARTPAPVLPPVERPPAGRALDPDDAFREVYGYDRDAPAPMPGWAYLFIGACALIPIVSLGGIVPGVLGVGGASACLKVARSRTLDGVSKFVVCAGITAAAWFGLFVLFVLMAKMHAGRGYGR